MTFQENLLAMSWKQATVFTLLFALVITLAGLNIRHLESGDESRVAGIAAETFLEHDYLMPRLNGKEFLEYPPLYYWTVSASYSLFGINDLSAKLPSALAAAVAAMILLAFARKLGYPPWMGLLCAVMLMTSAQFFGNSRKCMVDMMLATFILFSVFTFFSLRKTENVVMRFFWFVLFGLSLAGGIMTKGLIGAALPIAVLGIYLIAMGFYNKRLNFSLYVWLGFGTLLGLAAAGVWYWLLYRESGVETLHTVLYVNNIGRASGSQGDHVEPFYYYLKKLPSLFQPYLTLLPFAIWMAFRNLARKKADDGQILLLSFLLVPYVIFSYAAGKRIVYLLPLYAPAALLCGYFLLNLNIPKKFSDIVLPYLRRYHWILWILVYIALLTFAILSWKETILYPVLAAAAFTCVLLVREPLRRLRLGLLAFALFFASIDIICAAFQNEDSLHALFQRCKELEKDGYKIVLKAAPERTRGAAYFYLQHNVEETEAAHPGEMPPDGEVWIERNKRRATRGERFGDHHDLILPEKK